MRRILLAVFLSVAVLASAFAQQPIQQSTTAYKITFLMVDSTDHITGKTGLTPTVTISKAGAAFASPSGAVTELSGGWYVIAGNATDTNTNGELLLHATSTGADPTDMRVGVVVPWNPQDSVRMGLTALPNAAAEAAGGLFTRGTGAGQINQAANGLIDVSTLRWNGTAVATPATAGIPDVNVKNINNVAAATPGASGGILISGSNSGTTTLAALTITGATTHTGNVVLSDGLTISAPSTSNRAGITVTGNGTGAGFSITSGNGATGNALSLIAASTNGNGLSSAGVGTGSGLLATSGAGATGNGITATSAATAGQGFSATGNGTGHGILATSGGGATGDGFKAISAATNGNGLNGVGTGTGADIKGSGLEQLVSKAVASSFSGTVAANSVFGYLTDISATTAYDRTTMSFEAAFSNAPTVQNVVDGVLDEALSSHTTTGTVGKGIADASSAGDPWSTALPGSYGAGTAGKIIGDNITGNAYTRLGAPAGASVSADVAAVKTDTAAIKTKTDFLPSATAGASGGVLISGSNSGTTTLGAFTVTGATTHTGNFILSDGLTISAPSTSNRAGITVTGNGTGAGFSITGGNGASGNAMDLIAASTNGRGLNATGTGVQAGINVNGGATGYGVLINGGGTSGDGIGVITASGHGVTIAPNGSSKHGLNILGGNGGTSDGIKVAAGTGGVAIRANITGNITGTIDAVTTVNGLAANSVTAASIATDADTEIENSVLNALLSNHTTTGTVGKGIADSSSAGDPWSTALPGAYGAGTAGKIIGDNLTGNAFTRLGAPVGASISADVAAVKGVLPSALVSGRIDASVGAMANNTLTAAAIASDADTEIENSVLNATTAGHATAGSIGKAIADAGSAGDPWGTAVPGAYVAGTAGYIIGNNIKPVTTVQKNIAFPNFPIWMLSASGAAQTGLSTSQISCQYSVDAGAWTAITDTTETEIGLGKYVVDLTAGETNGNALSVICTGPSGTQPYRTNITPQH